MSLCVRYFVDVFFGFVNYAVRSCFILRVICEFV